MSYKALFLDRDGVINVERNYLYKIEDFEFIDGIFELCALYKSKGFKIIVVTNQSGISRGYYDENDFHKLTQWMIGEFLKRGVVIDKVYFCPHHPDIDGVCSCRKPDIGMFLDAQKEFDLDLVSSVMIGDNERDIEAAIKSGVEETYFFDEFNKTKSSQATKIIHNLKEIME